MEMNEKQMQRFLFAQIIQLLCKGELEEELKGAPEGVCTTLGEVWDNYANTPVGTLFNRPNFEEFEAKNKVAQN